MELRDKETKLRHEEEEVQRNAGKAMTQVLDDIQLTISPVSDSYTKYNIVGNYGIHEK